MRLKPETSMKEFDKRWKEYSVSTVHGNYFDFVESKEYTDKDYNILAFDYVKGLRWVWSYYTKDHDKIDPVWSYQHHNAPPMSMISKYMRMRGKIDLVTEDYLNPLQQLLIIMPFRSLRDVPKELHVLYSRYSPIRDLLPDSFKLDDTGKMKEYQSKPVLPFPTLDRIKDAISFSVTEKE